MVILLRHGATLGNLEGRYVGRTDEPLSAEGRAALAALQFPPAALVYVSPMRRALETARLIYPCAPLTPVEGFRECDFGAFEYHNHAELEGDARYQAWIDSGGMSPFPGGESRKAFVRRTLRAFDALPAFPEHENTAIVAHGGTLMALLSERALPRRDYFDWRVPSGSGYLCAFEQGVLRVVRPVCA